MSLQTPEKIRSLQCKLYLKAKEEPDFRFYLFYDKVHREDILLHAYLLCKSNGGASGVDGVTFEQIELSGREQWLARLRKELRDQTYRTGRLAMRVDTDKGFNPRPRARATTSCHTVKSAWR